MVTEHWQWSMGLLGIGVGVTGCAVMGLRGSKPQYGQINHLPQIDGCPNGQFAMVGWVVRDGGKNLESPTPMATHNG